MRQEYDRLVNDFAELYDLQKASDKRIAALKAMLDETKQQLAQARALLDDAVPAIEEHWGTRPLLDKIRAFLADHPA